MEVSKYLLSHTLKLPSSDPVTNNVGTFLFHDKTFTSESCASIVVCAFDLEFYLKSAIFKVLSTEQLANSKLLIGENSISSTESK